MALRKHRPAASAKANGPGKVTATSPEKYTAPLVLRNVLDEAGRFICIERLAVTHG